MLAANTVRAYRSDWADFRQWCASEREVSLPATPATVSAYVADLAGRRRGSTVARRLAAIAAVHRHYGYESPTNDLGVRVRAGSVRHQLASRQRSTAGFNVSQLRDMLASLPLGRQGDRDRAVLLLGYGAALRCSELVALDRDAVSDTGHGLHIDLGHRQVFVPYGSVEELDSATAWHRWSSHLGSGGGPAFVAVDRFGRVSPKRISPQGITLIVKRATALAGLDPDVFAAGSLRRGMVAAATDFGGTDRGIMAQTGHRTRALVRSYMAEGFPAGPA